MGVPCRQADESRDALDAMLKVFLTAQSDAAMDWNALRPVGVYTLPAELLAHICKALCLRDLISASGVSRGWRRTLLADKSCWTVVDKKSATSGHWRSVVFDAVLERSGGLALHLDLDEDYFSGQLLNTLGPHVHRIRSLKIGQGRDIWPPMDEGDQSKIIPFPPRPAPLLSTITVGFRYLELQLEFTPALQYANVGRLNVPRCSRPLDCLRTLAFAVVAIEGAGFNDLDVRELLGMCPNLKKLGIHGRGLRFRDVMQGVVLPRHITDVAIRVDTASAPDLMAFFESCRCLTLRSLRVKCSKVDSPCMLEAVDLLEEMTTRSYTVSSTLR